MSIIWLLWNGLIIVQWQWLVHILENVIKFSRLRKQLFSEFSKNLENRHYVLYFSNFYNSPTLVEKLFNRGIYCLGTVGKKKKKFCYYEKKTKIWKEVTEIFNMAIIWFLWNGLIIVQWQWSVHVLENVIKYLSHAQRLSKIKTSLWVVFISLIKKLLLTNWTTSHLVIWWISLF